MTDEVSCEFWTCREERSRPGTEQSCTGLPPQPPPFAHVSWLFTLHHLNLMAHQNIMLEELLQRHILKHKAADQAAVSDKLRVRAGWYVALSLSHLFF